MKKIAVSFLFFFFASSALAQRTVVSGTVTDVNTLPYSGASLTATLSTPTGTLGAYLGGAQIAGSVGPVSLDSTGSFLLNLADNTQIQCANAAGQLVACVPQTKWGFTITLSPGIAPPLGSGPQTCNVAPITISGGSQSVSSSFSACPSLQATGSRGGYAGTNLIFTNYTAQPSDNGKLISCQISNLIVTLPNPPPSPTYSVAVGDWNAQNCLVTSTAGLDGSAFSQSLVDTQSKTTFVADAANGGYRTLSSQALSPGVNGTLTNGVRSTGFMSTGGGQNISGCALTATVGGATAGKFASGTTGTCTVTINFASNAILNAPNGWTCDAHDLTTAADANNVVQTAFTTTTATMSGTTVSGDVITWKCTGF